MGKTRMEEKEEREGNNERERWIDVRDEVEDENSVFRGTRGDRKRKRKDKKEQNEG